MNLTTSEIIALKKLVYLSKGFDKAIINYELNTNRSHIQLGSIGPFISSYCQKQITVLMTLIDSNPSIKQLQPPEMIVHITSKRW